MFKFNLVGVEIATPEYIIRRENSHSGIYAHSLRPLIKLWLVIKNILTIISFQDVNDPPINYVPAAFVYSN